MNHTEASKKEITEFVELINEQVEMLKLHQGEIPQLYIDLLKKNVLKLYESIHKLDQIKHQAENIDAPETKVPREQERVIPEDISKNEFKEIKPAGNTGFSIPSGNQKTTIDFLPNNEETNDFKQEAEINEEKTEISFSLNPTKKPEQEKILIHQDSSDLFSESKPSIADKLSINQDPSLGEKMQQNQIKDMKSAIGINDKFLFINELFAGNLKDYNQAIDKLNSTNSQAEAMTTFNLLKEKFNWGEKAEPVIKLKTLIARKYSDDKF